MGAFFVWPFALFTVIASIACLPREAPKGRREVRKDDNCERERGAAYINDFTARFRGINHNKIFVFCRFQWVALSAWADYSARLAGSLGLAFYGSGYGAAR